MTAAFDRNLQVVLAREPHRGNDISGPGAAGDQCWTMVDHAVEELARLVVAAIAGLQRPATETIRKALRHGCFQGRVGAVSLHNS